MDLPQDQCVSSAVTTSIAIPVGLERALQMASQIVDEEAGLDLPTEATNIVTMLSGQTLQLHAQLRKLDLRLAALQRSDDTARRLATIPGIGPVGATALAASVADPGQFRSGRQSRPGWDCPRARTRAEARSAWDASPRWATSICGSCW